MMRSIKFFGVLALAFLLSATSYLRAEESTKGTIKSVDTGRKEVVLKGTIKDTIYDVDKSASIWLDGVSAKLGDLKAADTVVIFYDKSGEHLVANSVRALRSSKEANGTVHSTFGGKREFVIKGIVKNSTYELTKDATIWLAGKKVAMSDIRDGDEVRVTYEQRGDHMMANDVVIGKRK
jgi:hypothetical protein